MTLLGLRNWRQFTREFEGEWPSIWRKGCRPTSAGRSVILRVLKATGASASVLSARSRSASLSPTPEAYDSGVSSRIVGNSLT
jgi:hypothetical protein